MIHVWACGVTTVFIRAITAEPMVIMYLHKQQVTTPTTTAATAVVRDTGAAQKLVQCRISRKPKQINRPPGRNNCRLELSAFEALGLGGLLSRLSEVES